MTERLVIPTIVSSDDPQDTLRAVLDTLEFLSESLGDAKTTPAQFLEHDGRLQRLISDVRRQLDAETPDARAARQVSVNIIPNAVVQMAQFVVDGWAPPPEIAGQVLALLAREVVRRA